MSIRINVKSGPNKWEVEVDSTGTVGQLKEAISKVSGIEAANQRLIYSGKVLKDEQTVESYKIQDGHSIHLVKAGGGSKAGAGSSGSTEGVGSNSGAGNSNTDASSMEGVGAVPRNIAAGQGGGFNPLADLTGSRYAGYANLPSSDLFGPDGGLNSAVGQEEILSMLENPIFQSQMNEMLSNPQMLDFLIQQHPHLQAMGPAAREMLQSPFFRQMLTNPDIIRQMTRLQMNMGGPGNDPATGGFPAPGSATTDSETTAGAAGAGDSDGATTARTSGNEAAANPFASLLGGQANPFAAMFGAPPAGADASARPTPSGFPQIDPAMLSAMFGSTAVGRQPQPQDNRPPEERYEQQLRQLNDMGFFDFDRNVAALRRSGGSVQGALDALLNGDV